MDSSELRRLRNAFGAFLTGVTVVTSRESNGTPRGFTANSFTSVSLDPPMLLVCVDRQAESLEVFTESPGFAISILAEDQVELSTLFASKRPDKFRIAEWRESPGGYPVLEGVCAWFDCERCNVVDAGDHVVIFGKVLDYGYNSKLGLGFVRGGYMTPGLEYTAGRAYGSDSHVVVGAIVEHEGKILLHRNPQNGKVHVPASGLDGKRGSLQQLQSDLNAEGTRVVINSLFAVFENEDDGRQSIYYRASARSIGQPDLFLPFDRIPWERISSRAVKSMLNRYVEESNRQRFGIYFGSDRDGSVQNLL
ncbi:MAG: flavin reductase [Gammaproteobacteria bacterium]|nr:flavin reductase [Gammaproteobacteria bacterium]MYD76728.1 flavin reductase [Gammaproteobacteria bacterium]MYJ51377.1 flavin reductase [Gammaproteobacteria bacterium]